MADDELRRLRAQVQGFVRSASAGPASHRSPASEGSSAALQSQVSPLSADVRETDTTTASDSAAPSRAKSHLRATQLRQLLEEALERHPHDARVRALAVAFMQRENQLYCSQHQLERFLHQLVAQALERKGEHPIGDLIAALEHGVVK